jgi:hypothetical protein
MKAPNGFPARLRGARGVTRPRSVCRYDLAAGCLFRVRGFSGHDNSRCVLPVGAKTFPSPLPVNRTKAASFQKARPAPAFRFVTTWLPCVLRRFDLEASVRLVRSGSRPRLDRLR